MVETPKSSAENIKTSKDAIYWTEHSPNSKLNEIKKLLEKSDNSNIKNLMNFIVKQDYVWLQKAIGYKNPDGKLWNNTLDELKPHIEKEEEIDEEVSTTTKILDEHKQEIQEIQSHTTIDLPPLKVKNSKWEAIEKWGWETIRENDGEVEINVKKRSIEFTGIYMKTEQWTEVKFESIKNFYWKQTNDWIEIYSNWWKIPRLKINNDWTVVWILAKYGRNFDIKFNWAWTIFDTLKKDLVNKWKDCETPTDEVDGSSKWFDINWIKYRKWHLFLNNDWFGLYNNKTKKWEHINCIYNVYIKKDANDKLLIYSNGEKDPKIILSKDGIVKWRLLGNENELSYGAKDDTRHRQNIWSRINAMYSNFEHGDMEATYNTKYTDYITKASEKYTSNPIMADGTWNTAINFDNESTTSNARWNSPRQSASPESIPSNIEWKSVSITYEDVPMLDVNAIIENGLISSSFQTKKQLHINKIWKVWKEIYINQQFKVEPKRNNKWEKYYTMWQNIWWKYRDIDSSILSGGSYRWTIYEDLNKKYFS